MTEDYKPTDNAVAERINGIIKAESSHPRGRFNDIGHARNVIARYIHFYNHRRPHMSIGYKIPAVAHLEKGIQKKMWKKKKYPSTSSNEKKDAISLQSRTSKYGFCKSSKMTVNRIRTTHFAVSTISAYKSFMIFKRYSLYSFMKSVELVAIGVVPFVQKVVMILILIL